MVLKNCSECVILLGLKNCGEILEKVHENCTLRKKCNMTRDFFSGSSDQAVTREVLLVSAVILLIFLILKDGVKGLRIRAHWIPSDFLVLSALTIELLNLISTQGRPLELNDADITLNVFWMIHTSRIMLCVVIAYLIPAMANPGAEDFWGKIMALAIIVFLHVLSELYIVNPNFAGVYVETLWPKQRGTSLPLYYVLAALMFFSFVLLLLLLGCANIAGRGIERILEKKIPLVLRDQAKKDHCRHHHHLSEEVRPQAGEDHRYHLRCQDCWRRVEDALFRAWVVARAYSLEHIISRSALACSTATIVTFQIAITIVAGVWNSPKLLICSAEERLVLAITMLQCVFILIGWSMIAWRWATAVAYYENWSSCIWIEDFWTRHLRELQQAKQTQLPQAELLLAKVEILVANESTKIIPPRRLLYAVIGLQRFTVSFSKTCLLVSQILFRNKLTGKLLSLILSKLKNDYYNYEGRLKGLQTLGETSESLWLSNRNSIRKAVELISRGKEDGERCQHLVDFLATKRTGRALKPNKPQTAFKYLWKRTPIDGSQESPEEQFTDMSTKSRKMAVVSLLSIIVQLSPVSAEIEKEQPSTSGSPPSSVFRDCLKAYSQAWEIVDFVDKADTEADEITNEAADQYFFTLQAKVDAAPLAALKKESKSKTQRAGYINSLGSKIKEKTQSCVNRWSASDSTDWNAATTPPESVTEAFADLKKKCKGKTQMLGNTNPAESKAKEQKQGRTNRWNGSDSRDWNAVEWGSAVYRLCDSIDCNEETNMNELLKELESSLADIINECLDKIQNLLFLNSRKWAVNSDERKTAKALYTAGKARKIIEMLKDRILMEEGNGSAIVPYHG